MGEIKKNVKKSGSDLQKHQLSTISGKNNRQNQTDRHRSPGICHIKAHRVHRLSMLSTWRPIFVQNGVKFVQNQ